MTLVCSKNRKEIPGAPHAANRKGRRCGQKGKGDHIMEGLILGLLLPTVSQTSNWGTGKLITCIRPHNKILGQI